MKESRKCLIFNKNYLKEGKEFEVNKLSLILKGVIGWRVSVMEKLKLRLDVLVIDGWVGERLR